jgi:hypothetical protein
MITHVFAVLSPAIRPWSAAASIGSVGVAEFFCGVAAVVAVSADGGVEFAGLQAMDMSTAVMAAPKLTEMFGIR